MPETKRIIAVRHGESETNSSDIYQAGDQFEIDPLNETGQRQAEALAERFKNVPVDIIIASSYLRALQTARPIQRVIEAPLIVPVIHEGSIRDLPADAEDVRRHVSLLRELDLPSELAGLAFKDPRAVAIKDAIKDHLYEQGWHYSDEENLYDAWDRAGMILKYLEDRPEQTVAVVAHGGILKMCIARITQRRLQHFTERQQLEIYESFSDATWWDNAGVDSLNYNADRGWQWLMSDNLHNGPEYFAFMPDKTKPEKSDTAPGDVYEK